MEKKQDDRVFKDEMILNLLKSSPIQDVIAQLSQFAPPIQMSCGPDGCF